MHAWTESRVPSRERRRRQSGDFIHGQQILMRALSHLRRQLRRQDAPPRARDAMRLLLDHLTSQFRADDRLARPTVQPVGAVPAPAVGHSL